ncbi:hypothetical protein BRD14_00070 [Halobacteriales archaeon SW_5_68_122]|nr:MAG: hypothetical protein BRD14_00070 [Halobacteriales archaeon SW_5_68_122]
MPQRSDIAPETLRVSLDPEGVEVEYLDGRSVFYHGVPTKRGGSVVCGPGRESTGVGRVLLDGGEETSLFPGVEAANHGYRIEVAADPEAARGRVFVFAEDEMGEAAYEIVAEGAGDAGDGADGSTDDGGR